MNINEILYLVKNSNLKNMTKSFLFSVVKDASSEPDFDLGSTGQFATTPESLKELDDLFASLTPTSDPTPTVAVDSGVEETDSLLDRHAMGEEVANDELNKIQPWEDYYRDVLDEKLMEGTPYTYEDLQMINRLKQIDSLRAQRQAKRV